ncbi:hypothetical protein ACTXJU_14270 [Glutamicibacter ardleyensis]|uniref:hypothetical protein n=1 Tax=Glutamicibacter ardleyensis TaxID=225894 RepID=UPI003FCF748E
MTDEKWIAAQCQVLVGLARVMKSNSLVDEKLFDEAEQVLSHFQVTSIPNSAFHHFAARAAYEYLAASKCRRETEEWRAHLIECSKARNSLKKLAPVESSYTEAIWAAGMRADRWVGVYSFSQAPKSQRDRLLDWFKYDHGDEAEAIFQARQSKQAELIRRQEAEYAALARAEEEQRKLDAYHRNALAVEKQIFSAQKFWPETGER